MPEDDSQTATATGGVGANGLNGLNLGADLTITDTGGVVIAEAIFFAGADNAATRKARMAALGRMYGIATT